MTWELVVIGSSLWLAAGMTSANILYRRGHDDWRWMCVCAIAGPLALPLVVDQARVVEPDALAPVLAVEHRLSRRRPTAPGPIVKEHRAQG